MKIPVARVGGDEGAAVGECAPRTAPSNDALSYRDELGRGWKILFGCTLGLAIGVISIPVVALSIFMAGFQRDFGWSRTEVSGAYTVLLVIVLMTSPVIGWLCDRVNVRSVTLFSHCALGLAFLGFSRLGGDLTLFIIAFGVMALAASGASTVAFSRVLSANFVKSRGLALGIGMSGFGVTSLLMPLLMVPYVSDHGWRNGTIIVGVVVLALAPLVSVLLPGGKRADEQSPGSTTQVDVSGLTFAAALQKPTFWTLAFAFALISLGVSGINIHFVSMMTDVGMAPARAGAIASGIGVSTIVIRLVTGWLIDRFEAQVIAALMVATAAACLFAFATWGAVFALAGAFAYGLGIGSELDIVGYLTARHFGMRAYGRIYGTLYAAVLAGSAFSPLLYGMVYQQTGQYVLALEGAALCMSVAAVMIFLMPRAARP